MVIVPTILYNMTSGIRSEHSIHFPKCPCRKYKTHKTVSRTDASQQRIFPHCSYQGRRHLVTVFCGDTVRWFTAKCSLRWTFPMNMMSNDASSDRPLPTCKTSILVIATIFSFFKANIQRWRPSVATTKEVVRPSAAQPVLWFPLYCFWIR